MEPLENRCRANANDTVGLGATADSARSDGPGLRLQPAADIAACTIHAARSARKVRLLKAPLAKARARRLSIRLPRWPLTILASALRDSGWRRRREPERPSSPDRDQPA